MATKTKALPVWSVRFEAELLIAAANMDDAAEIAQEEIEGAIEDWTPQISKVGIDDGGEDVIRR